MFSYLLKSGFISLVLKLHLSETRADHSHLFQGGWGKRGWDKFHGSWGKRDSDLDFDVNSLDNDVADEELVDEESGEDMKRAWSSLKGGWGKRAADWANFRGQFSFPLYVTDSQTAVRRTSGLHMIFCTKNLNSGVPLQARKG